jgi:NADPH-dependent curcumin reductase CurA
LDLTETDVNETINRQWLFKGRPEGALGPEHFEWRESPAPSPRDGEVLLRVRLISIDPANRAWMNGRTYRDQLASGDVMDGIALGEVVQSADPNFETGDIVEGLLGWQDYTVKPASALTKRRRDLPLETQIGLLGPTGRTAYHGVIDVARVRAGETVVISGAGGAVGSIAGQIAKLSGCRVIGIAGGSAKCAWLTDALGFDGAVDYKAGDLRRALKAQCPDGIDVYFDNTGGEILDTCVSLMNQFGRIACCGNVSQYNVARPVSGPVTVPGLLVTKRLRMEGFLYGDFTHTAAKAEQALARWAREGKLAAINDIVDGLENAPAALIGMFEGRNRGKLSVRVTP